MRIGIPGEIKTLEGRAALIPATAAHGVTGTFCLVGAVCCSVGRWSGLTDPVLVVSINTLGDGLVHPAVKKALS